MEFGREGFQRFGQVPNFTVIPHYQLLAVFGQGQERNALAQMIASAHCRGEAILIHVNLPVALAMLAKALRMERTLRHADILEIQRAILCTATTVRD